MTTRAPETYVLAARRVRSRPLQWLFWLTVILSALASPIAMVCDNFGLGLLFLVIFLAALLGIVLRHRTLFGGELVLANDGLRVARKRFTRKSVIAGYRTDRTSFLLRERNGQETYVELSTLADPAHVDRILAHLELGVGQRAIEVPLRPLLGPFTIWTIACGVLGFAWFVVITSFWVGSAVAAKGVIFPPLFATAVAYFFGAPRLIVGADGLRIRRAFRGGLYRYASLASVVVERDALANPIGIVLERRDGTRRVLRMYGQSKTQLEGLDQRIADSLARATLGPSADLGALEQGTQSIPDWRRTLASKASAVGGFRDAMIPVDALERVLDSGLASVERRVGAALALRDSATAPTDSLNVQKRILVAAEASADPAARRALAAVAADEIEDAELGEALVAARKSPR